MAVVRREVERRMKATLNNKRAGKWQGLPGEVQGEGGAKGGTSYKNSAQSRDEAPNTQGEAWELCAARRQTPQAHACPR